MARFQTRLAELLDQQTKQMPEYAKLSWRKLSDLTGVSVTTLTTWNDAAVGSDKYIDRVDADVLGKLMAYFGVEMDQLIVVVQDETASPPQLNQETAIAASVAA